MRDLQDGSALFSVANPATYVRVYVEKEDKNSHYHTVPLKVLDRIFSSFNYEHLIESFLDLASKDQKVTSVLSSKNDAVSVPDLWEKWQEDRGNNNRISFRPIPGVGDELNVSFLGDAYEWYVTEKVMSSGILKATILACIEKLKEYYRLEENGPKINKDVRLLFSLPRVKENGRVILDCSLITTAIKKAFGVKVNPYKLARDLSSHFVNSGDYVEIAEQIDGKGILIQGDLTAHHVFSKKEAEDYEARNSTMDECMFRGSSTEDKSRIASFDKVVGSKIYLRERIGMYYPPTFYLRFYFGYVGQNRRGVQTAGPYETHEWFTKIALPKFVLAVAKLHAPEVFS